MIKYFAKGIPNPKNRKEIKYYPQMAHVQPLGFEEICQNITEVCTVTRHDVKAVLSALQAEVIKACQNGQSIRLGDLGSFRPTITSRGVAAAEKVSAGAITNVHCRFTEGSILTSRISKLNIPEVKFQKVEFALPAADAGGETV